jgi:hypothetical protein
MNMLWLKVFFDQREHFVIYLNHTISRGQEIALNTNQPGCKE